MAIGFIAAAAAAPLIGGVIGHIASRGERKKAEQAFKNAFNIINQVGAPPDLAREILYKQFYQAGVLTPELEEAIELGISRVSQIQEDLSLRQRQMEALDALSRLSRTGIGPEERAAFNQLRSELQRESEAKKQQILQNLASRGLAGSGAELIASLQASQGDVQRASQEADRLAAMASQRALESLSRMGALSSQIRGQEFDIARTKAAAEDEFDIRRFNEAVARQRANIERKNLAQQLNLAEKQRIIDQNINLYNRELLRQREAELQNWENKLRLAQAKAHALTGQGQMFQQKAADTAQMWSQLGGGLGSGLGAVGQYLQTERLNDRLYNLEKEKLNR